MKWLAGRDIPVVAVDIVQHPPSAGTLAGLHRRSGLPLARFFNTSGASYRTGHFREKLKTMTEADAFAALAADGKLIKRPLVDAGNVVLVGFEPADWARALQA